MNILITSAGRRNELIEYFRELSSVQKTVVCDLSSNAAAFQESDVGYIAPPLTDSGYADFLLEVCRKESIDIVITLNDLEIPLLCRLKDRLKAVGATAIVSDPDVINVCWDKSNTSSFLKSIGCCVPKSYDLSEINEGFELYPIIIKPRFGTSSIGVEVVESFEEFEPLYNYAKLSLSKTLIKKIEERGGDLLIQEKVVGTEYAVDVINNLLGEYIGCVVKRKLGIRGGDADCVVTVHDKKIEKWCQNFAGKLKHIGNADCDLIVDGDDIYCVDINPRFGGAYPFSHLSGINIPEMLVAWVGNKEFKKAIKYQSGLITARTEKYLVLTKTKNHKTINVNSRMVDAQ